MRFLLQVDAEVDRAHDAVAELLVDELFELRSVDLQGLVEAVDGRVGGHRGGLRGAYGHRRQQRDRRLVEAKHLDQHLAEFSRNGVLAEQRRRGPDDRSVDGIGQLLPGQALGQSGDDNLLGNLVARHGYQHCRWAWVSEPLGTNWVSHHMRYHASQMGFVRATIAPSGRRCASRISSRAKRAEAASSSHCTRARSDPTVARRTGPSAVINAMSVPAAPLSTAVTVTRPSALTCNVCPGPPTPLGQDAVRSSATSDDRARYERPLRNPSTIAGVESSSACTTVWGKPTCWCSPCESLPPTAGPRRPCRNSRCQGRSENSSSIFQRPFHTSSASTSWKPNSHAAPGSGTDGCAATTSPPASRTSAANRGNTPSLGPYRHSTHACGGRPTASQCPWRVVTSSPGITSRPGV